MKANLRCWDKKPHSSANLIYLGATAMNETNVSVMEPGVSKSKGSRKFVWVIVGILAFVLILVVVAIVLFKCSFGVYYTPSEGMAPTLQHLDHITANKLIYRSQQPAFGDVIVFNAPPAATQGDSKVFVQRVMGVPGDRIRITGRYVLINDAEYGANDITDMTEAEYFSHRVQFSEDMIRVDGRRISKEKLIKLTGEPAGAKVKIVPGAVYRNGKALNEAYTWEDPDRDYPNDSTPSTLIVTDKNGNTEVKVPAGKLLVMGDNRNNSNDGRLWGMLDRKDVIGKVTAIIAPENRVGPVE